LLPVLDADGVLEGLLELYMAESRCSTVVSPCSQTQQQQCCGSECNDEGQTCGVCLDAAPSAAVNPCKHTMCGEYSTGGAVGGDRRLMVFMFWT
jgi:hypothetical protein